MCTSPKEENCGTAKELGSGHGSRGDSGNLIGFALGKLFFVIHKDKLYVLSSLLLTSQHILNDINR